MGSKFSISEVCSTSWQRTKAQIWVLSGLIIGMSIISFTLGVFAMPIQQSVMGAIVINLISCIISCIFALGYMKNIFQALDGEEPQFSAYGQQARKIITYLVANILMAIIVTLGLCLFIIPGIYLALRLQFYAALIVEDDAGIIESLQRSWEITRGQEMSLFMLMLAMIGICILGLILLGIGIFVAMPLIYMMYAYVFRKLNAPLQILEEV
ncbi:hypothetical protein HMPREF1212_03556 [Parabacteroides sp. HGS0025]|jgi:uncharacterized membrane protein|uniref:DUF975 family protein n=1 Tax=Parabacteroides sp. HGS0025 TaxID=1078087 RepID=UPI0006171BC5|nr:DUF975 family protein [Parabacteroides sp. HGS0025]KKB48238.1 hypothetical protein HMPREF1212_03556 [Parabacteroides sp. HGS0025]